jgi:hypothetical protein
MQPPWTWQRYHLAPISRRTRVSLSHVSQKSILKKTFGVIRRSFQGVHGHRTLIFFKCIWYPGLFFLHLVCRYRALISLVRFGVYGLGFRV